MQAHGCWCINNGSTMEAWTGSWNEPGRTIHEFEVVIPRELKHANALRDCPRAMQLWELMVPDKIKMEFFSMDLAVWIVLAGKAIGQSVIAVFGF